ncbi:Cellulose/chitin-binding protein N-terminal [Trinorchestia longiramus]|nr:Cellulose/chitin-binding protein N-terminal [Trinorchestia longiramus]
MSVGRLVVQYGKNDGKCGVCGDVWTEEVPRSHEAGGIFGNGFIAKRYTAGQVIEVEAELTTNHKGWMELRLCPNNNKKQIITEECLAQYQLPLADGSGPVFVIPENSSKSEIFRWKVKLPEDVTCSHCVIRWKYFAGNTWGICSNGSESVGCGNQETFINCADVIIYSNTPTAGENDFNPWALYFRESYPGVTQKLPQEQPVDEGLKPLVVRSQRCIPVEPFNNVTRMDEWCMINCLKYPPNCHPSYCKCVHDCSAVGEFALLDEADIWCHQNCLKNPSYCPPERCHCV